MARPMAVSPGTRTHWRADGALEVGYNVSDVSNAAGSTKHACMGEYPGGLVYPAAGGGRPGCGGSGRRGLAPSSIPHLPIPDSPISPNPPSPITYLRRQSTAAAGPGPVPVPGAGPAGRTDRPPPRCHGCHGSHRRSSLRARSRPPGPDTKKENKTGKGKKQEKANSKCKGKRVSSVKRGEGGQSFMQQFSR